MMYQLWLLYIQWGLLPVCVEYNAKVTFPFLSWLVTMVSWLIVRTLSPTRAQLKPMGGFDD